MEYKIRSMVKSIIWRIVGVVILASVTYFYTHKWIQTTWITFLHHGVFLVVFFLYERFWQRVNIYGLKRRVLKAVIYEDILGMYILGVICLIITGHVQTMTKITLTYIGIKNLIYVVNEFIWDKWIRFGKSQ